MNVLIFSDVHASVPAAKKIQSLASGFDELYCCGDICGYNKDFEYVIDMLIDLDVKAVKGNHDHMVLDESFDVSLMPSRVKAPIYWARRALRGKYREYLENLPDVIEAEDVYITHTVDFDFYITEKAHCDYLLSCTDRPVIGIGHTHVPALFRFGDRVVVNPGSIAFGRKNNPRSYAVVSDGCVLLKELVD